MSARADAAIRELDHRSSDCIDVTLLWDSNTNRVLVAVEDDRSGDAFELEVNAADARDAFQHPYAYERRHIRVYPPLHYHSRGRTR